MSKLAALCVKRPVFATVLILVLVVFGVSSYMKLGIDRFPKIDFPIVTVPTRQPGSAAEEIETELTDKIEGAVNTVNGIEELRSISSEGISQVIIQFVLEKDIDVAAQDVRDKISGILPELPEDIDQPVVTKLDPDAIPVLTIAVSAPPPATMRDITEYCDKVLRRQLESIDGVGQVTIVGGQARQINVNLDPLKLRAYRLTVSDVARALKSQNLQMPSGSMKVGETEYTLRTLGRVRNMPEMEAIAVANRDGRTITIGDLGTAEDSTEEMDSVSFRDETPCVLLNIRKQSGTNTVAVAHHLKERLETLKKIAPPGYEVDLVRDQSVFIETSVHAVQEHLLLGGALAAIVVFIFLANLRGTIIAAIAIPSSIIAAFTVVYFMGFTLNSMTLLALTLSVGIVIDDAIVVMENIFRFIEEKKQTPMQAAVAATKEIALAVLAITISLVAVFMPIAMMQGIVGRFLYSFGVTMCATIMVSMLVSFTLTPMLASRWFKAAKGPHANPLPKGEGTISSPRPLAGEGPGVRAGGHANHDSKSKSQPFYRAIEAVYLVMLRFSLRQRWLVVLLSVAALISIVPLAKRMPVNFLPDDDSSEFQVNIQAPEGTTLEATQVLVSRICREIRQLPGVKYTIASVADNEQRNPYQGTAYVRLVNLAERDFSQFEIMDYVRKNILPKYDKDNLRLSVTPVSLFSIGGVSAEVQYMIAGPDIKKLETYAKAVMKELRKVPGAVDVDSSLTMGKPQYGISIDRPKAAELGVNVAEIANTLRLLVAGDKVSDFNDNGEQYEVHVRAIADIRNRLEELKMMTVPSSKFGTVPLDDVVRFDRGDGPAQINRQNRVRQVTINANLVQGTSQKFVQDEIQKIVDNLKLDPQYRTGLLGKSKEMRKMLKSFLVAFIMAFIFVYLCIAAQFESWLHPITILLSLPLTLPFALISLLIFRQSINIFSLLGIMVLFAVVKKNSILQIDHANQLRAAGMPKFEAIVAANRDRLRPILMTTAAFVAGMIPTFLSNAEGSAVNKAISGVIIGGQTLSLLLTLLAVPVAYSLFDDLSNLFWRMLGHRPTLGIAEPMPDPLESSTAEAPGGNGDTLLFGEELDTAIIRREASHASAGDVPVRHP
jgi:HAE1 family hydrophobic/amphiphilic exporter-1